MVLPQSHPGTYVTFNRARVKTGGFLLEGLNSLSTTYYFYYIFFFLQKQFDFDAMQNLLAASGIGFVYALGSFFAGRFSQKFGYFNSLKVGCGLMCFCMLAGSNAAELPTHIVIGVLNTIGMCFTWPALEALVSEKEPRARLQKYLGVYNVIWAAGGALAYFSGGALLDYLGPRAIFLIPAVILTLQFILAAFLSPYEKFIHAPNPECEGEIAISAEAAHSELPPKTFLRLALVANPFAYISINSLIPVMPTIANKLELTPTEAGIFGSTWFFMRAICFLILAYWKDWHYRWKWLGISFLAMIASFITILLSESLVVLILAQVIYGFALGLLYYSSLFYSMDVSETKGEHGGIHEAVIGAGNCLGPAIGAGALAWLPYPNSGAWAVTILLVGGYAALLRIKRK